MGSTFILNVRMWQKPFKTFFQQGTHLFMSNASMCKSQPPPSARFLCTRDSVSIPDGRYKNKGDSTHGGVKKSTTRHPHEELWGDAMTGKRKTSTVRQTPAFPKSVFAAGTAKRTAEMLRRKSALVPQDEEDHVEEPRGGSARGAGRRHMRFSPFSEVSLRLHRSILAADVRLIHVCVT